MAVHAAMVKPLNKPVTLSDNSYVTLQRSGMSNPSGLGAFVVIGMSSYEMQIDAAYTKKDYTVQVQRPGGVIDSPSLSSARVGLTASLKYKLLSVPGVAVFAGAGAGVQLESPIAGVDLIKDEISNSSEAFKPSASDILKKSNTVGFDVLAQVRIKPPTVPLGLMVAVKGLILPSSSFEKPSFVPSVEVGLGFFPF